MRDRNRNQLNRYKTVSIPRGYIGLKIEVPGCIVYVEHRPADAKTIIDATCDLNRFAGDEWVVENAEANKRGVFMRCARKGGKG